MLREVLTWTMATVAILSAMSIVFLSGDTFGDPAVPNGVGLGLLILSVVCVAIAAWNIMAVNYNENARKENDLALAQGPTKNGLRQVESGFRTLRRLAWIGVTLSIPVIVVGATVLDNGREARKINETEQTTTDFLRVMVLNVDPAGQMVLLPISYDREPYGVHPEYFWDRTFVCHQPIALKAKMVPEFAKTKNTVVVVSVTSNSRFSNRDCFGWPPKAMSLHELVVTKKDIDIALREAKLK